MPFAPTRDALIEVIHLADEQRAPIDQPWIRITDLARGVLLTGNLPCRDGLMDIWGEYRDAIEAEDKAVNEAIEQGCGRLYVEQG